MINLLPPAEKTGLKVEFRRRLLSVYLFMFSVVLGIGLIVLLPSYFLVDVREGVAEEERASLVNSAESSEREDVNDRLRLAKERLTSLNNTERRPEFYVLIDEIVRLSGSTISINSFAYTRNFEEVDSSLLVSGSATTRDGLIAFTKALEENAMINEAVLPVSALAKDKNISFNIEIKGLF